MLRRWAICSRSLILCISLYCPFASAQAPARPPIPDELRLNLMIRGTIIALSQANQTGNYSVLRDLGTPGFQMANNPARLAEIFGPLRARKLDLTPIMFFNPKLSAPPSVQDGQVLRMTGVFTTTPEQVSFDLAYQLFADQWMLAGIAVNTTPATDAQKAQTSSLSSLQAPAGSTSQGAEKPAASGEQRGDAKPVRIDLSEPAPLPAKKPKKAKPPREPAPAAQPTNDQPPPKPAASNDDADSSQRTRSSNAGSGWRPE